MLLVHIYSFWLINNVGCSIGNCTIVVVANGRVALMTESQSLQIVKIWSGSGLLSNWQNYTKIHSLFFQNYTKLHSLFFQERTGPTSLRGRLKMGDDHRYQVFASANNIISSECSDFISWNIFLGMQKLYLGEFCWRCSR